MVDLGYGGIIRKQLLLCSFPQICRCVRIQLKSARLFRVLLLYPEGFDIEALFPGGLPDTCKAISIPTSAPELQAIFACNPADNCLLICPARAVARQPKTATEYYNNTALHVYQKHRLEKAPRVTCTFPERRSSGNAHFPCEQLPAWLELSWLFRISFCPTIGSKAGSSRLHVLVHIIEGTACRQSNHSSKLSLVITGNSSLPEGPNLSGSAALSLGLARTLFMEDRSAYGTTVQFLTGGGHQPGFEV